LHYGYSYPSGSRDPYLDISRDRIYDLYTESGAGRRGAVGAGNRESKNRRLYLLYREC